MNDFEITKREVIASVVIIAVLLIIGLMISDKITDYYTDQNEEYYKAIKTDSTDMFKYGMDTNIGNAFVYGELKALDTVGYSDVPGEYSSITKVQERYTQHTRRVSHTTGSGKTKHTYYTTETYYTWDEVKKETKHCEKISFCGIEFCYGKINIPNEEYIDTVNDKRDSDVRYVYYGSSAEYTGTIFTRLENGTVTDATEFYKNKSIDEAVICLENRGTVWKVIFWILWVVIIAGCTFGFYYLKNEWLE